MKMVSVAISVFLGCTSVLHAQSSLKSLEGLVGKTNICGADLIRSHALSTRLRAIMGADLHQLTSRAVMCGFAIVAEDDVLLARNMRPHRGTEEESLIIVDEAAGAIEVKLLHDNKIYTYAEPGHAFTPPPGWQDAAGWRTAREVKGRVPERR